jgi:hypothetical protein
MSTIKTRIDILEQLYSKEIENIIAVIETEKESLIENRAIFVHFDKVLSAEKKYERFNLIQIADIFENYGWYVKIVEEESLFDFS